MGYTVDQMKKERKWPELNYEPFDSKIATMLNKVAGGDVPLDKEVDEGGCKFFFQSSEELKSWLGGKNETAIEYFKNALKDIRADVKAMWAKAVGAEHGPFDVVGVFADRVKEAQSEEKRKFSARVIVQWGVPYKDGEYTARSLINNEMKDAAKNSIKSRSTKSIESVEEECTELFVRKDEQDLDRLIAAGKDVGPDYKPTK